MSDSRSGAQSRPEVDCFVFTFRGKGVLTCYSKKGTDGWMLFGVSDPNPKGAHLSSAFLDGKLRTHVTDPSADNPQVLGRNFTPEYLASRLVPRYKRLIRSYHPNRKAWVMTPALKRRVSRILPRVEGRTMYLPLEGYQARVALDFHNRRRWRKVRVRDLLGQDEPLVYIREGGRDFQVRPLDNKHMLCMTARSVSTFTNDWANLFGFTDYMEYIEARISPELSKRAQTIRRGQPHRAPERSSS